MNEIVQLFVSIKFYCYSLFTLTRTLDLSNHKQVIHPTTLISLKLTFHLPLLKWVMFHVVTKYVLIILIDCIRKQPILHFNRALLLSEDSWAYKNHIAGNSKRDWSLLYVFTRCTIMYFEALNEHDCMSCHRSISNFMRTNIVPRIQTSASNWQWSLSSSKVNRSFHNVQHVHWVLLVRERHKLRTRPQLAWSNDEFS